jgi:hypothetical protein
MGKLFGKLAALLAYVAIATLVAEAAGVAYWRFSGQLTDDKVTKLVAVAQGVELEEKKSEDPSKKKDEDKEEPSYDDRQQARDLQARNLELREQSIKTGLELLNIEKRLVTEEKTRYETLKRNFDEQLKQLREGALTSGRENVRLIWENIKPKQAKEQILGMLVNSEMDQVVSILSGMPISKRAKIVSEFKTPEEAKKLDEILRMIRDGVAEVNLIDKTKKSVN